MVLSIVSSELLGTLACVRVQPAATIPSPLPVEIANMPSPPPALETPLPVTVTNPPPPAPSLPTPVPVQIQPPISVVTSPIPNPLSVRVVNPPSPVLPFLEPPFQVQITNPPSFTLPVPLQVALAAEPTVRIQGDRDASDWLNLLLTALLTAATFGAVWLSKSLNDVTKQSAAAMAETAEAQLRPYVTVESAKVASFARSSTGMYAGKFEISLKNTGATFAKNVAFDAAAVLVVRTATARTPLPPHAGNAYFPLPPGGTIKGTFFFPPLTAADVDTIRTDAAILFLTGIVEYTDTFKKGRKTTFCFKAPVTLSAENKLDYWGDGNDAT
jgi:hypothetical protein